MSRRSRPTGGRVPKRRRYARRKERLRSQERKEAAKGTPGARRMCVRKRRYPSREAALIAAEVRMNHGSKTLTTYHCPICGGWHLTSKHDTE